METKRCSSCGRRCCWRERVGEVTIDRAFIEHYTEGFDAFVDHVADADHDELLAMTGLDAALVAEAFDLLARSDRVIICWAMGVTQHRNGVATIDEIVNFALLGGHIGRPGAGLCPVRGHSNVQGNRTVGIWEQVQPEAIEALERRYGLDLPRAAGHDTVESVRALRDGRAQIFFGIGGNFARATPDTEVVEAAFASTPLVVNVSTKLNRSHLLTDHTSIILPALGRTDLDEQNGTDQFVTVEDSMTMVHSSRGGLTPPGPDVKSEVAIICLLAVSLLGTDHPVPWAEFRNNYDLVRDAMAETIHGFADYNRRVRVPGGFELPHPPRDDRRFPTDDGKAHFSITRPERPAGRLLLQTMRSHDQYNTTIYGHDDRYRGIRGDRHVILLSSADLAARGLTDGDRVDIITDLPGPERRVRDYLVIEYPTPPGAAAAYYPETNALIPLDHHDPNVRTPASKSIPIRLERR
ncbi:MAG: molybdopterin dinucleotide binding domain-containing protein [Acidimicrobiales bacterium]